MESLSVSVTSTALAGEPWRTHGKWRTQVSASQCDLGMHPRCLVSILYSVDPGLTRQCTQGWDPTAASEGLEKEPGHQGNTQLPNSWNSLHGSPGFLGTAHTFSYPLLQRPGACWAHRTTVTDTQ